MVKITGDENLSEEERVELLQIALGVDSPRARMMLSHRSGRARGDVKVAGSPRPGLLRLNPVRGPISPVLHAGIVREVVPQLIWVAGLDVSIESVPSSCVVSSGRELTFQH